MVMVVMVDLDDMFSFYCDVMGFLVIGFLLEFEEMKVMQVQFWGMGEEFFEIYLLRWDGVLGMVQIWFFVVLGVVGVIYMLMSLFEFGFFLFGFLIEDVEVWDQEICSVGFDLFNVIEKYQVLCIDGLIYGIYEMIFNVLDFVYVVIILWCDGMVQFGLIDFVIGCGGLVYLVMIVEDSEVFVEGFFVGVLGFELCSDCEWMSVGMEGVFNVLDGIRFCFVIIYVYGVFYGYQFIFEFCDD